MRPWAAPFPLVVGALTLAAFAYLAATYLTVEAEAEDPRLADDFRARALGSGAVMVLLAIAGLLLSSRAPLVREALAHGGPGALPFHLGLLASSIVAVRALLRRRFRVARLAAAAQVSVVLWGWAWAQSPWLVPPDLTLTSAAAPPVTLRLVLIGLAVGSAVLAPSLWYLFRLFKGQRTVKA